MENTNLTIADLRGTDLTNIKNQSLTGADLSYTSFLLADLSGISLSNISWKETNFWKSELPDIEFTVVPTSGRDGIMFYDTNLSNSNFEGMSLSPSVSFTTTFENKAHLKPQLESDNWNDKEFVEELFGTGYDNKIIISVEITGNDLFVNYIFFNNFSYSNLENANFKNASLVNVKFHSANLVNADLSGADLRGADLSGANLSGANLSGAIYDDTTNLKCLEHNICI